MMRNIFHGCYNVKETKGLSVFPLTEFHPIDKSTNSITENPFYTPLLPEILCLKCLFGRQTGTQNGDNNENKFRFFYR